jgi:uncharacterized phage protein (TIGR01671 family)
MREIKFRAWLLCGEWNEAGTEQAYEMVNADALAFEEYEPLADLLKNCENLMQYTGLKDRNGKEIYEGDIVKGPTYSTCTGPGYRSTRKKEIIFKVESYIGCYGYAFTINGNYDNNYRGFPRPEEVEVIGNIYESPELLKSPDRPELPL